MVWVAISEKGISDHYVHRSKNAITSKTYLNQCLKKRLLPFIQQHHQDNNFVFWPDQASAHYAKIVLEWLDDNNIEVVEKRYNPPNLPQARPIETFWAQLSQKVYSKGWEAKTLTQLIRRINFKINETKQKNHNLVQTLMVLKKLRKIADNGVYL